VAAEDYTDDIRFSDEILKRLVEAYRRIRNTARFILGNLYDFDSTKDMVSYESLKEMDKWALHRLQEIIRRVREAYDNYQFHVVYYTLYNFCIVDLSALYLDVLKDRLYTSQARSPERLSAQSAMCIILDAMVRLLAPILTFTAEEIWEALPPAAGRAASVHLTQFPQVESLYMNPELAERWKTMISLRAEISKAIEIARKNKIIGHSLDAAVDVEAPERLRSLLIDHSEDMRALLIVSQINFVDRVTLKEPYRSDEIEGLVIGVTKASGQKCGRCWIYSESVGSSSNRPELCERCMTNLGL
jgi:isoleucyl-tRNA synthetase